MERVSHRRSASALAALSLMVALSPTAGAAGTGASADAQGDVAAKVQAAAEGKGKETSIPFADNGGIQNWRAIDRDTLLIEGRGHKWYRAELMGGCFDLPFADRVGFKSNPTGDFDRFSTVIVRGQRCQVKSLTETAPPPKPAKRGTSAADTTAGATATATPPEPATR